MTKAYSYDIYKTTEIIDSWLNHKNLLDQTTKENIVHLYTLVSANLLDDWDLSSKRLAQVIHPRRVEDIIEGNPIPLELKVNLNIIYLKYGGQINDLNITDDSFSFIEDYFKPRAVSQEEQIALVLFYNYWSMYTTVREGFLNCCKSINYDFVFSDYNQFKNNDFLIIN